MSSNRPIDDLLTIMRQLRDPQSGCPWDVEQDFWSIAPYTIEEAYEVADAIERDDMTDLREELGDLLLQVVFHAQMAKEAGFFGFDEVAGAIVLLVVAFGEFVGKLSDQQTCLGRSHRMNSHSPFVGC